MPWNDLAPRAIASLARDLQLTPEQAAGVIGQLGFESEGLQPINERQPVVPGSRGGFGWAQWTGPRRQQFEQWAQEQGLDINTPDANYGFLLHELQGPESRILGDLRKAPDATTAGRIFTQRFLRPGEPHQDQRDSWAQRALEFLVPSAEAAEMPQETGLAGKIEQARQAGYSDDEIRQYLSGSEGFASKLDQAKQAGYSDDEIWAHFGLGEGNAQQPAQQPQQPEQPAPPEDYRVKIVGTSADEPQVDASRGGIGSGILMGLRNPVDAGAQLLRRAVPERAASAIDALGNQLARLGLVTPSSGVEGVDRIVNDVNQQYEENREAAGRGGIDLARLVGNTAGMLPALATGSAIGAAVAPRALTTLGGRIAGGAAQGATYNALLPVVGSDQDDFSGAKKSQATIGAVAGGVASPVVSGLARVIAPKASQLSSNARKLLSERVELTPGQALGGWAQTVEDKMMSVPIMGDAIRAARVRGNESLNRAVYNRVLAPIGARTDKLGRAAVDDAHRLVSKAYDDVLADVKFRPDNAFAQRVANLRNMARTGLPVKEAQAFERILERDVLRPMRQGQAITGETFKDIESNLGNQALKFHKATDAYQNALGDAVGELQTALRENLQRMNPGHAERLADVNRSFAMLTRLETAASRAGAHDGVFTGPQLASAVRQGDKSARRNAYARGNALLQDLSDAAQERMSAQIPNSGTTDRLLLAGLGLGATGMATSPTAAAITGGC